MNLRHCLENRKTNKPWLEFSFGNDVYVAVFNEFIGS